MREFGEFGASDWGRRWLQACAIPDDGRGAKGRSYARAGAVVELKVEPGQVTALVQGSRPRPYAVAITAEPLDEEVLAQAMALHGLRLRRLYGREAQDGCRVLNAAVGPDLFPFEEEPEFGCSCPDRGLPCKHAVAAALAFARAVDGAPGLWLTFRFEGQSPLTVVGGRPGAPAPGGRAAAGPAPAVPRGRPADPWPVRSAPQAEPAPEIAGPTAAEVWGDGPRTAPVTTGAAALAAPAGAEAPLLRLTPPPWWAPEDPDLDAVLRDLAAALATVAGGDGDFEAEIKAAYAAGVTAQARAQPGPPTRTGPRISAPREEGPRATPRKARVYRPVAPSPAHPPEGGGAPASRPPAAQRRKAQAAAPPTASCGSCHTPVEAGWLFCPGCGRRLPGRR